MRTNAIKDARGQPRRVCQIAEAAAESGMDADRIAPAHARARFWKSVGAMGTMFTLVMIPVQGLTFSLLFAKNAFVTVLPFAPVYFLGFGLPMGWMQHRNGWRSVTHARDAMLSAGLCPACAHGIGGVPPEQDGCIVCPECGAAWEVASC